MKVEAGGYIIRCISTQNTTDKDIYVVQFSLIVLAPVLMAAACYVIFVRPHQNFGIKLLLNSKQGRIVFHVVPREARTIQLLWISPRFVTPIFVASDVRKFTQGVEFEESFSE